MTAGQLRTERQKLQTRLERQQTMLAKNRLHGDRKLMIQRREGTIARLELEIELLDMRIKRVEENARVERAEKEVTA